MSKKLIVQEERDTITSSCSNIDVIIFEMKSMTEINKIHKNFFLFEKGFILLNNIIDDILVFFLLHLL